MSFRSSTPYDLAYEEVLCQREFDDNLFDQYLNLDEPCRIDEATILAVVPRSPQLATAPSPSHSQASGFEPTSYLSHRFSRADSDIGYWSNYSRPPSPVGRGRSKTFGEDQLLRTRPGSGTFEHDSVAYQSPPIYTLDSSPPSPTAYKPVTSSPHHIVQSLRRKKSFSHRSASSIRSAREPSRERDPRRSARSVSRSAIRKQSSPPKMPKSSSAAYAQVTIEEWNAKLTQQAQQFDFGFPQPISPPPSARVSDASSSESTRMRSKALTQQRRHQQQQQQRQQQEQQYQQQQQTEQWQAQQYAVVRNSHIPTPSTTPRYHEASRQHNHNPDFMSEASQWTTDELQNMNGSFDDMSFVVDGGGNLYWDEPAHMSEQETSPVVLSHNESFPQPMAVSPISSRNTKQLQIALPPSEQRPDWPTIDTNVDNSVDVDLTISPGVRPTPIALTNSNHFAGHAHTRSLPNIGNSMLLQAHVSMPPSPTRGRTVPDGGEPSPLRHRESGSYFSNVAPPPMPAYLQSQQASPMLSQNGSPMRMSKSRQRQMEDDDYSSPPSRSVSPASFSQSFSQTFPNALGIHGINNASTSNFSTPHPHPHPYGLSVRKSRTLNHRVSEPTFTSHHQRGRSSLGYTHPYQPSGSPSPRQSSQSRAKMHARSKSSSNLRSISSSAKRSSPKKAKDAGVSMSVEFHNYTPKDGNRILSGVAPSGSSKTKARREKEAREKQRRLSLMAVQAVRDLGGDPGHYLGEGLGIDCEAGDGSGEDGMELEVEAMDAKEEYDM